MPSLTEITQWIDPSIRSDKSDHYLRFYEELFSKIADEPLSILEIGVFHGGSMLMFAKYFAKARLLGLDINLPPPRFYEMEKAWDIGERIHIAKGSQSDQRFVQDAIADYFGSEKLDIVIDDASHMYRHTRATFDIVFQDYLKSGGYYIIEDWGCGYWPKWPDGNPNGKRGLPKLVKELVDLVALADRTRMFQGRRAMRTNEDQESPIARMIVAPSVIALVKA